MAGFLKESSGYNKTCSMIDDIPRIYCKGSPLILRVNIVGRSPCVACFIHRNSLFACRLPMRAARVPNRTLHIAVQRRATNDERKTTVTDSRSKLKIPMSHRPGLCTCNWSRHANSPRDSVLTFSYFFIDLNSWLSCTSFTLNLAISICMHKRRPRCQMSSTDFLQIVVFRATFCVLVLLYGPFVEGSRDALVFYLWHGHRGSNPKVNVLLLQDDFLGCCRWRKSGPRSSLYRITVLRRFDGVLQRARISSRVSSESLGNK